MRDLVSFGSEPLFCKTNVLWATILLGAILVLGCGSLQTPFESSAPPSLGPIGLIKQRCEDARDFWDDKHLQCRAVAPWKKP